jgi:purine-binding chemotaxis protein CheW
MEKRKIDWSEVHRRLDAAPNAPERGSAPPSEEKKRILKERAKTLARETEAEEVTHEYLEVVEFSLAYETYGIESSYVREVYPLTEITPLPGTPPFVLGIVNVRGQILSVIDLKRFFGLPEKGLTDLNKVIILHNDRMEFGVLADVILGVRLVPLQEIQPSLPTLTDIRADYLKGVTQERLIVLEAAKILSDRRMIVHEEVEA